MSFSLVLGLKERKFNSNVLSHENFSRFENEKNPDSSVNIDQFGFFILEGVPKEESIEDGVYIGTLKRIIISKRGNKIPIIKNYIYSPVPDTSENLAELLYTISTLSPAKARATIATILYPSTMHYLTPYFFHYSDPFSITIIIAALMFHDRNKILFPSNDLFEKYTKTSILFPDPTDAEKEIPTLVEQKINSSTLYPELLRLLDLSTSDLITTCLSLHKIYNQTSNNIQTQNKNPKQLNSRPDPLTAL